MKCVSSQMGINLPLLYCCINFALQQLNNSNNSVCVPKEATTSLLCNSVGSVLLLLFHWPPHSLFSLKGKNVLMT